MSGRGWLIILFPILLISPIGADPETRLLAFGCATAPYNNVKVFERNLNKALAAVVGDVIPSGFSTISEVDARWMIGMVDERGMMVVGDKKKFISNDFT